MNRRSFLRETGAALAATALLPAPSPAAEAAFRFNYAVPSAMYGGHEVEAILPEIKQTGAAHIDLWPAPHGTQREQVHAMGDDAIVSLLTRHNVKLGISTCYKLGPFKLQDEMRWARGIANESGGAKETLTMVCGARGKKGLEGKALKKEVKVFVEKMKPHAAVAAETHCVMAIENHKNSLITSPDSIRYFADLTHDLPQLGLSFAPHHLPQDGALQGKLVHEIGPCIKHFYAQQYGNGSHEKQPWEKEMLQMPGRGDLDFAPIVQGLKAIQFTGFTEIFMHPFPRGVPIRESVSEITAEINWSRKYLEGLI